MSHAGCFCCLGHSVWGGQAGRQQALVATGHHCCVGALYLFSEYAHGVLFERGDVTVMWRFVCGGIMSAIAPPFYFMSMSGSWCHSLAFPFCSPVAVVMVVFYVDLD